MSIVCSRQAMNREEDFSENYFLLRPEDASVLDLLHLLFSSDVKPRSSVECPDSERLINFQRRWYIFVSIVAQKCFRSLEKPINVIGTATETWLNLVPQNGGVFKLLFNFLRGNVIVPDRSSATFRSLIGNLDLRVDLDKNIKPHDSKYYPSLSIMAAKLSYENEAFIKNVIEDHWKMKFLGYYRFWNDYQQKDTTHSIMLQDTEADPNLIVVAFRGTDPFDMDDWRTDVDLSWYQIAGVGKVHHGFMKALNMQSQDVQDANNSRSSAYYSTKNILKDVLGMNENAKFIVTGHSLGGALAILFVTMLVYHEEKMLLERLEGVYTFGQPRIGDKQFGDFMEKKLRENQVRYLRFVYCNDVVPRVPYDDRILSFEHFGVCLYYDSLYYGKVVKEEPNKNYFNLLWVIPKMLNAVWELVRGFILPYVAGPEYREGWYMRCFRVIGLIIPGLSAHCPQDYVNSTRLRPMPSDASYLQSHESIQQYVKVD